MKKTNNGSEELVLELTNGVEPTEYIAIRPGASLNIQSEIVEESFACLTVNGKDVTQFMCSPTDLDYLAAGFLYNENIIDHADDIKSIHISKNNCIDIWINQNFQQPSKRIVTAGCGGGVTFDDLSEIHKPLNSDLSVRVDLLADLMKQVHIGAKLYQRSRGIHTAAITDQENILIQVEDIGRHNCIDKLAGAALLEGIQTKDRILFSSGRISSEMLNKARRMEIPIVCSRTSPTSLSVSLTKEWNITLIGYLRQKRMRIYNAPERILNIAEVNNG